MSAPKTPKDLVDMFRYERDKARNAAAEARVRADVWDEAFTWASMVYDVSAKAKEDKGK